VVTGHEDHDLLVRDQVDEAVLVVDPSRPCSGQVVLQRLGLTDPREGVTLDVLDELASYRSRNAVDCESATIASSTRSTTGSSWCGSYTSGIAPPFTTSDVDRSGVGTSGTHPAG
jgi:hypothetical protein